MIKSTLPKVKLQSSTPTARKIDWYEENRSRLSFLPSLFFILSIVGVIGLGIWYFRPFNSQPYPIDDPSKSVSSSSALSITGYYSSSINTSAQANRFKISNKGNLECYVNYSPDPPGAFAIVVTKATQGWWLPDSNCQDKNLLAIQIVRLEPSEIDEIKGKLSSKNVQLIDEQNNTFALVYMTDKVDTSYNLERYIKSLTQPIFTDKIYLNLTSFHDSKRVDTLTYYLDGSCQGEKKEPCRLWQVNNFSGEVELVQKNVINTAQGQENEIPAGYSLRFAKNQDLVEGLNFILVNDKEVSSKGFRLIRLDTNSLNIIETSQITLNDQAYKDYYR